MGTLNPITIVGGGVAGLTLGIGLRRHGIPVTVWEAGRYPRHRVCGEFISGRGQDVLTRCELREPLMRAGARPAQTAAFFSERTGGPVLSLPAPALCLSRFCLDEVLAREFRRRGGELRENERWRANEPVAGVVRASGRRVHAIVNGWRYFGLKVHARNVRLTADLEMHLTAQGYLGICRLARGTVNICGLFRSRTTLPDLPGRWREYLQGQPGSPLHQRLAAAVFDDDSFCSVAGLAWRRVGPNGHLDCSVGDAWATIPPVTGNGMSMALESAEWAIEPLLAYSRGEVAWERARDAVTERCERGFGSRLAWARWLHRGLFQRGTRAGLVCLARRRGLGRLLFAKTR